MAQDFFIRYEAPEIPVFESNLFDKPIDISDWAEGYSPSGDIILNESPAAKELKSKFNLDYENIEESSIKQYTSPAEKPYSKDEKQRKAILEGYMDEVSEESGFEGLKDPEVRKILLDTARRESSFVPTARSKTSTASGYFLFIDDTRKQYTNLGRLEFMNNPKEQVRAAYKYYLAIQDDPNAKKLKARGFNKAVITNLGWWLPDSMRMILNGVEDYSLGGSSIKTILKRHGYLS